MSGVACVLEVLWPILQHPSLLSQCSIGFPHHCHHYGLALELPAPGITSGYTSHSSIISSGLIYTQPSLDAVPSFFGQNQLIPHFTDLLGLDHNIHQYVCGLYKLSLNLCSFLCVLIY